MKVLYVTDRASIGEERLLAILERLAGGPLSVELREKDAEDREVLRLAMAARERLGPDVPLTLNGRFDLALAAGADGVHLPSDGLPVARVRAHTPHGFTIGVSTHAPGEAADAIAAGANVVVIGPIFDTPSKRSYGAPLGPAALAALPPRDSHGSEVLAIGGIGEAELEALEPFRDRISGIAAIRLFQDSADPRAAADRIAAR
jgi:thiamine-phosphate pyrophosphorylase